MPQQRNEVRRSPGASLRLRTQARNAIATRKPMNTFSAEVLAQYSALVSSTGFADLSSRTQIEFTGADRASFLHNLCTNEVKKLPVGEACEAFITNVQGRTIGHGYIFCRPEALVFSTVPGQGEFLLAHFEKYHIREKVEIRDRTSEWGELLLFTSLAAAIETRSVSEAPSPTRSASEALFRIPFLGSDSCFLSAPLGDIPLFIAALRTSGGMECSPEAVEMARLEAGTPLFGRDITDKNLPQEVARDQQAISFTKGCYLGQETVARLDALGHVNQLLCGVHFRGDIIPTAGTELRSGERVVGHVTSADWSVRLAAPLALAYVRREQAAVGTLLSSPSGESQVISLPIG